MQPESTVEELPSIWFIRRMRTVLAIVCQLMSAYRAAKAERWGQLNCDETKRHQTEYLNLILSCVEESCEGMPAEYKPILMSACSLRIEFALSKTKQVRKKEQVALRNQQEKRAQRLELMKKAGYEKATQLLIDCLYYHDMYYSERRLRSAAAVDEMLGQLKSKTAKLDEIKEQIRIRVLGLGWEDLHHPWSKDGKEYSVDILADWLKNKIIPEEDKRPIPEKPPVKRLERKALPVLGTLSADVAKLNVMSEEKEQEIRDKATEMRDERELDGVGDRYGEMQPRLHPALDESLIDRRIEICLTRGEQLMWHSGKVVGIKRRKKTFEMLYDEDVVDDDEPRLQEVKLLPSFWIKAKQGGWRLAKEEVEMERAQP